MAQSDLLDWIAPFIILIINKIRLEKPNNKRRFPTVLPNCFACGYKSKLIFFSFLGCDRAIWEMKICICRWTFHIQNSGQGNHDQNCSKIHCQDIRNSYKSISLVFWKKIQFFWTLGSLKYLVCAKGRYFFVDGWEC